MKKYIIVVAMLLTLVAPAFTSAQTVTSIQNFTVTPSTIWPNSNAYHIAWTLQGVNQAVLTVDCQTGLSVKNPETDKNFACGESGDWIYGYDVSEDLQFTNTTNQSISVRIMLSPAGINSVSKTVTIPATKTTVTSPTVPPSDVDTQSSSSCVVLSYDLRYRSRDISTNGDVSSLQDLLQSKGYLNSEPTGYFGLITMSAVKAYQKDAGINPTGFVGPITRAKIKIQSCGGATVTLTRPVSDYNPNAGCQNGATYNTITGAACSKTTPAPTPTVSAQNPTYKPVITRVSGKASNDFEAYVGQDLAIEGSYLSGNTISTTNVYIGGIKATVKQASDNLLYIVTPELTSGTYDLYVSNEKGQSNKISVIVFSKPLAITILNSNTSFKMGQTYNITWSGSTPGVDDVSLHLITYKGGRTELLTIGTAKASAGSISWTVPTDLASKGGTGSGYTLELRGKAYSIESAIFSIY